MADRAVMIALGTKLAPNANAGVNVLQVSIGKLAGLAAGIFSVAAVYKGVGMAKDAFASVIESAMQGQDAVNGLKAAFQTAGYEAEGLALAGQRLASELQKQTRFGDDAIMEMQALLVTYGVMPSKLEEATRATLDFAAATGRDLRTAAELVGKAAAGATGQLSRYGIVVDTTGDKAEVFGKVLAKFQEMFGGRAAADARTYAGQMAQLANVWDDLKEKIGGFVVESGESVSIMGVLKGVVEDISEALDEYGPLIRVAINDGLKLAGELMESVWAKTRQWVEQGGLVETWQRLKSVVLGLKGIFQGLWGAIELGLWNTLNQVAWVVEGLATIKLVSKETAQAFRQAADDMGKAGLENIAKGWESLTVDAPRELMNMDQKIAANRKRIEEERSRMAKERAGEDERIARAKEQALERERRKLAELTAEDQKRLAEEQKRLKTMAEQYGMMSALERAQVRSVLGKLQAGGQAAFEGLGGKEMEILRKSDVLKEFVKRQGFAEGLAGRELGQNLARSVLGKVDVQAVLKNEITAKLEVDGPSIAQQIAEKVMPKIHEVVNSALGALSGSLRQVRSAGVAVSGAASG